MTVTKSSTGGRIIKTKTGLIHYGNTDHLIDEWENKTGVNGRPTKESVEEGLKFDFTAFPQVAVPQFSGQSHLVTFK
jgi:hypothetical protein